MFGFKKKQRVDPDYQYIMSKIKYSVSSPRIIYEVNADEEKFFMALVTRMKDKNRDPIKIRLTRLADGTFNVNLPDRYLGKVRLQGKNNFIQFMKNTFTPETVYAETVDDLIPYISKWIK